MGGGRRRSSTGKRRMILLDFSMVCHVVDVFSDSDHDPKGLLKQAILLYIGRLNGKLSSEYGEMVICCDGRKNWRKQTFPHYKASRKEKRKEKDQEALKLFYEVSNETIHILDQFLPFPVVKHDLLEGDDAIACLAMEFPEHKHIIVSSDRDFFQLHAKPNVQQYHPTEHRLITPEGDPRKILLEHIIKGDSSDGIPNILMPSDFFINKQDRQRQKSITKVMLESPWGIIKENRARFKFNRMLIDFSKIPDEVRRIVVHQYMSAPRNHMAYSFFVENRMDSLVAESMLFSNFAASPQTKKTREQMFNDMLKNAKG